MRKLKTPSIALAGALILAAGGVWALAPSFEELDRDGDGYISRIEAAALTCLSESFHRTESESDRGLNRGEFEHAVSLYCRADERREHSDPEEWPPDPEEQPPPLGTDTE